MSDESMRRHLSPEEAAEQRRRARERRAQQRGAAGGGAAGAGAAGAGSASGARFGAGRPGRAERPDPRAERGMPGGERRIPRDPRDPRDPRSGRDPRDPRDLRRDVPRETRRPGMGAAGAAGAGAAAGLAGSGAAARAGEARGETPGGYQPTQRPERWDDGYASARPRRASRDAPPTYSAAGNAAGRRPRPAVPTRGRPARATRAPRRKRRFGIGKLLILLLVLVLVGGVATVLWADSKLQRIAALTNYEGRPGSTRGEVTLIVGTDSREGLTPEQQAQLATGDVSDAGGDRTDTMMLLYKPSDGGKPMIISIPRDLLVSIPEYGDYKINAAYGLGGPQLLVQVIEQQTGVRIDHYAEIGFGGFASMVDDLGGVEMCLDNPIDDPDAGINLAAGCQNLTGPQALGFVRTRHTFAQQDLERVQNQRKFLSALMNKASSPATLANPFKLLPFIDSVSSAMKVDKGDHIWSLASVMWAMKSDPVTATVPFDGMASGSVGSYLVWGDTTNAFFDAMRQGKTPSPDLYEQPPA